HAQDVDGRAGTDDLGRRARVPRHSGRTVRVGGARVSRGVPGEDGAAVLRERVELVGEGVRGPSDAVQQQGRGPGPAPFDVDHRKPPVRVARSSTALRTAYGTTSLVAGLSGAGRLRISKRYSPAAPAAVMTCEVRSAAGSPTITASTASQSPTASATAAATLAERGNAAAISRAGPRPASTGAPAVRSRAASSSSIHGGTRAAGRFVVTIRTRSSGAIRAADRSRSSPPTAPVVRCTAPGPASRSRRSRAGSVSAPTDT